jgi:RNA polymerase sigma-70 factor (ECF subfamily)
LGLEPNADDVFALARSGDRAAFAALINRHQKMVYSVALRMLGQRELAEDMAQEVFIQLHAKLASLESPSHLIFWLRRAAAHRAIDQLRRPAMLRMSALDEEADRVAVESPEDPLLQRRLRELLLKLNPVARAVMTLRYQEDLDPPDIADILDMPLNTVKSHLKRSLETLRQHWPDASQAQREGVSP